MFQYGHYVKEKQYEIGINIIELLKRIQGWFLIKKKQAKLLGIEMPVSLTNMSSMLVKFINCIIFTKFITIKWSEI